MRIKSLLVRLGEKTNVEMTKILDIMHKLLVDDIAEHKDFIIKTLFQCVVGLPTKTALYGILLGLINVSNSQFGFDCVQRLHDQLRTGLLENNRISVRILIRFLGCLANARVVSHADFLRLLSQFTAPACTAGGTAGDFPVYVALSCLPWVVKEITGGPAEAKLLELQTALDAYMDQRPTDAGPLMRPLLPSPEDDQLPEMRCLDTLETAHSTFKKYCEEGEAQFTSKVLLRPHEDFDETLSKAIQHAFVMDSIAQPRKVVSFRLLPDFRLCSAPEEPILEIDSFLVRESIRDTVALFEAIHKEGTKQLLSLLCVEFEYLHLIVETIISDLFTLPTQPFNAAYHAVLFIDIFKALPKQIPPVLGRAIHLLFMRLPQLDLELRDRLAAWFSFHLSNFGYKWPWANWAHVADLPHAHPQRIFVQEVLTQCLRLASWNSFEQVAPGEEFAAVMPARPIGGVPHEVDDGACIACRKPEPQCPGGTCFVATVKDLVAALLLPGEAEDSERLQKLPAVCQLYQDLFKLVRARAKHTEVLDLLNLRLCDAVSVTPETDSEHIRLKLLTCVLLHGGSKSFSHYSVHFAKYQDILSQFSTGKDSQLALLSCVRRFWTNSSQHMGVIVNKLLHAKLVTSAAVIDWVFLQRNMFHRPWLWDTLFRTVSKTVNKIASRRHALSEKAKLNVVGVDSVQDDTKAALDALAESKRQMLTVLFQHFQKALSNVVPQDDTVHLGYNLLEGRFKQFVRTYPGLIRPSADYIRGQVFTDDVDEKVIQLYNDLISALPSPPPRPTKEIELSPPPSDPATDSAENTTSANNSVDNSAASTTVSSPSASASVSVSAAPVPDASVPVVADTLSVLPPDNAAASIAEAPV